MLMTNMCFLFPVVLIFCTTRTGKIARAFSFRKTFSLSRAIFFKCVISWKEPPDRPSEKKPPARPPEPRRDPRRGNFFLTTHIAVLHLDHCSKIIWSAKKKTLTYNTSAFTNVIYRRPVDCKNGCPQQRNTFDSTHRHSEACCGCHDSWACVCHVLLRGT